MTFIQTCEWCGRSYQIPMKIKKNGSVPIYILTVLYKSKFDSQDWFNSIQTVVWGCNASVNTEAIHSNLDID